MFVSLVSLFKTLSEILGTPEPIGFLRPNDLLLPIKLLLIFLIALSEWLYPKGDPAFFKIFNSGFNKSK